MVQGVRVLKKMYIYKIYWMERRKGIEMFEMLGWEVITAPFELGF